MKQLAGVCYGRNLLKRRTYRSNPSHCVRWSAKPEKSAQVTSSLSAPTPSPPWARHVRYNRRRWCGCRRALHICGAATRKRRSHEANSIAPVIHYCTQTTLSPIRERSRCRPWALRHPRKPAGLPVLSLDIGQTEWHFSPAVRQVKRDCECLIGTRSALTSAWLSATVGLKHVSSTSSSICRRSLRLSSDDRPQTRHRDVLWIGGELRLVGNEREIVLHIPNVRFANRWQLHYDAARCHMCVAISVKRSLAAPSQPIGKP